MGCNYIATGHYAKTEYSDEYKKIVLKKSNAGKKTKVMYYGIFKRFSRTYSISFI